MNWKTVTEAFVSDTDTVAGSTGTDYVAGSNDTNTVAGSADTDNVADDTNTNTNTVAGSAVDGCQAPGQEGYPGLCVCEATNEMRQALCL